MLRILLLVLLVAFGNGYLCAQIHRSGAETAEGGYNNVGLATGGDTYVVTPSPAFGAYRERTCYTFTADVNNTGPATLNINALGAVAIQTAGGDALEDDMITGGLPVTVCYDPTTPSFILQGAGGHTHTAGTGISLTETGADIEIAVDSADVATLAGNNDYTGNNDFSVATELRTKLGAAAPVGTDCDAAAEVARIYLQSGDPASVDLQVWMCFQTGASSYAWEPVSHLSGTTAPASCEIGSVFFDTDATAGSNWFGCTAADTWTVQGGSSPLTTKGDLYGYDTGDARVPVGTDGMVLRASSADAQGVDYAFIKEEIYFDVGSSSNGGVNYPGGLELSTDAKAGILTHSSGAYTTTGHLYIVCADAADDGGVIDYVLPSTYQSTPVIEVYWWINSASTNTVRWAVDYDCSAVGEDATPNSLANAGSAGSANAGDTLLNKASVSLTLSTCAAGEELKMWVYRDGDGTTGTDDLTADAYIKHVVFSYLRSLQ